MPRLSQTRSHPRVYTVRISTMPPARGIHNRAISRYGGERDSGSPEEDRERERTRSESVPVNLAIHGFPAHAECHAVSRSDQLRGVLLHPPPRHWHTLPASCDHRVAKELLLCLHKPRPPSRAAQSRCRPWFTRYLFLMSIPEEHHYQEPSILLACPDTRLSASLPAHSIDQVVLRRKTPGGIRRSGHVHLASLRAVRRTCPTQLN